GKPSFDALRLDPLVMAFGPGVRPLPRGAASQAPVLGGWEEAFLRSPRMAPPEADEALGWQLYKVAWVDSVLQTRDPVYMDVRKLGNGLAGGWPLVANEVAQIYGMIPPPPLPDEAHAI